jgi:hypothetical protein
MANTGGVIAPPALSASGASGGSLGASTTYYYYATCLTNNGEGRTGPEASSQPGTGHGSLVFTAPTTGSGSCGATATGWNLYSSTASGYEVRINTTPLTLGVNYTMTALANNGNAPVTDMSNPACAVYDLHASKLDHVKMFTGVGNAPFASSNGFCGGGSSAKFWMVRATGFYEGIVDATFNNSSNTLIDGPNNVDVLEGEFQNDEYAVVLAGGARMRIQGNDFEENQIANIWIPSARRSDGRR